MTRHMKSTMSTGMNMTIFEESRAWAVLVPRLVTSSVCSSMRSAERLSSPSSEAPVRWETTRAQESICTPGARSERVSPSSASETELPQATSRLARRKARPASPLAWVPT